MPRNRRKLSEAVQPADPEYQHHDACLLRTAMHMEQPDQQEPAFEQLYAEAWYQLCAMGIAVDHEFVLDAIAEAKAFMQDPDMHSGSYLARFG